MSGVYIHSTSAIRAILKSGEFHGTTKEMQMSGASAKDLNLSDEQLHTLFVEWRKGNVAESVSRLNAAKGDIRGVLVFTDPKRIMRQYGDYPAVFGGKVPLTQLSLRGILVAEEDLKDTATTWEDLRVLVRPFVGTTFAFDAEPISTIKNGKYIMEFLLSAANNRAFF